MANELSARPRGGKETVVASTAYLAAGLQVDLDSARRLILLIHGYNNSEHDARCSFAGFRRNLAGAVPREQLWEFHWPGDHAEPFISKATYPVRVLSAILTGQALKAFLSQHRHADSLVIVAHSLGCRVALETAFQIAEDPAYAGPPVEHIFLMAAAVPSSLCDTPAKRFPAPLPKSREHIFYSSRDVVLAAGFAPFQSTIGVFEEGEAVGYRGLPAHRWTSRTAVCLKHGQYWESRRTSRHILATLTLGTPPAALPERCLGRYPVKAAASILRRARLPARILLRL